MSKYFIWVTDYYSNTGEGKLAINYLKKISEIKQNDYFIKSPDHESNNLNFFLSKVKKFNFKKSNFSKFYRYFIFIKGIFYLWLYYLRGKKVIYVNYLPLWNFLIFMLSPPKTIFGPITGTPNFINKNIFSINFIVRKYIFPKFFVLSNFFLKIRNRNIIFSTSLLKKNVFEDVKKKSLFDFQLLDLKIKYNNHKKKKLYDLAIYNRKHSNKNLLNYKLILNNPALLKYKVLCFGEKILLNNVTNVGYISNKSMLKFLCKTKFALISEENLYSFFFLDVLKCGALPIISSQISTNYKKIRIDKSHIVNFRDKIIMIESLKKILNSTLTTKIIINKKYLVKLLFKFNNYFIENFK